MATTSFAPNTMASSSPPPQGSAEQAVSPTSSISPTATAFQLADIRPTPNAIRVLNLSPTASEKAVKEFFAFCGKIILFQMIICEGSTGQSLKEAFILFDRESAANTSLLLTNAVIVDRSVVVRPFFDAHEVRDPVATVEANERDAAAGRLEGHKPLTRVVAELLASGYTLTEGIVKKGLEIDCKYSVSKTLSNFLVSAQSRALALDQKYRVTGMLWDIDARLHITENATAAIAKATEIGGRALGTAAGQRVVETVVIARDKALSVASETRQIVHERRNVAAAAAATPTAASSSTETSPLDTSTPSAAHSGPLPAQPVTGEIPQSTRG